MSKTADVAESCLEFLLLEIVTHYTEDKDPEKAKENCVKLEEIGVRVGGRLVERETLNRLRINEPTEALMYLAKDIWSLLCKKSDVKLKTNHKGLYTISDPNFRWLGHVSFPQASYIDERKAGSAMNPGLRTIQNPHLSFFTGLLKGALTALDFSATIYPEIMNGYPYGVVFTFKNVQASSSAPSIPSSFSSVPTNPPSSSK